MKSPLLKKMKGDSCWKGYVAKGKKKSPSGKKTKSGKIKMVNNCVKNKYEIFKKQMELINVFSNV